MTVAIIIYQYSHTELIDVAELSTSQIILMKLITLNYGTAQFQGNVHISQKHPAHASQTCSWTCPVSGKKGVAVMQGLAAALSQSFGSN